MTRGLTVLAKRRPEEADEFAGDRDDDLVRVLAARFEAREASGEAPFRFFSDRQDPLRLALATLAERDANRRAMTVLPGGLDERAADARFADILADFASRPDGSVAGTVRDEGDGGLAVEGGFELRIGEYRVDVNLGARGDPAVAEALRHVGVPQPDGSSRIELHGPLLSPF